MKNMMMRLMPPLALTASLLIAFHPGRAAAEEGFVDQMMQLISEMFGSSESPAPTDTIEEDAEPSAVGGPLFARPVQVSFREPSLNVLEGQGTVNIPITLSGVTDRDIRIRYQIIAGSAQTGTDYVDSSSGQITVPAGVNGAQLVQAYPENDDYREDKSYAIELQEITGAALGNPKRLDIRISENDPEPAPVKRTSELVALPGEINFGVVRVGSSYDADIEFRVRGETDITVTRLEDTADAVRIVNSNCINSTLLPENSCNARIRFAPDADGGFFGTLIVRGTTNGSAGEELVETRLSLRGEGEIKGPARDMSGEKRAAAQDMRRQSDGFVLTSLQQPVVPSPREYITSQEYDPDYGPGNTVGTYPINLERIVLTTQSIPCVVENGINTQLPGQIQCVVETPVYSYHGKDKRLMLIPPRSYFEGTYSPLAKQGDTRANFLWQRLVKPDGSMIWLPDGFPTLDAMGRTGMPLTIDNRWWEQFGTPILLTAITALATELVPQTEGSLSGGEQILVDGSSRIINQMLSNNLDLSPIGTIPSGSRLAIKPTVDMMFLETGVAVLGAKADAAIEYSRQAEKAEQTSASTSASTGGSTSNGGNERPSLAAQPTNH